MLQRKKLVTKIQFIMETKGIEEMTIEELIDTVHSLSKELSETKEELAQTQKWWDATIVGRELLEKKIAAAKAFWEVM